MARIKFARLMAQEGIKSVHRKKYRLHTTVSKHLLSIAENMVEQNFNAEAPNQIWASDISYIPTREGFVYWSVILDFYSRKIVG